MSDEKITGTSGFGSLFERVTVMHATDRWSGVAGDVEAVLGSPKFSDGSAWAAWDALSVSDETDGPAWSLLARTADLEATVDVARALGWHVGERTVGAHETRVPLRSPHGLTVIAYTPTPAS
ncbi:hypothetical protein [Gordonia lacunae]|uniref:Glyoxalase-like domain-containing protein n=1 Tax=Gordonia lacunae TaxID=417102 RepID=A0A243Q591_9ACTN|nr:hypothetical protein [Gordonia lacunae]OUC76409.1 hypothetical protein CA982_21860 [Gordonia lacunae]